MTNAIRFICAWIRVITKLMKPGGAKAIAAENVALRQQLITLARQCKRSPKLKTSDRIIFGLLGGLISLKRLKKIAVLIKPATVLKFHQALVKRKYHLLFSRKTPKKPGRKGPSESLINLIVEMKKRNPAFGYLRIAMQIEHAFGIQFDKGVVRRALDKHFGPEKPVDTGPSWLSFIGQMTDGLWSVDLFRCESILLKSHWVMLVMDHFSCKIIGYAIYIGSPDGAAVCCMFNKIIAGKSPPKYLSSDNDPLFTFHRWKANCRIRDITEIKSVPYTPQSHPFVERLIGTARREFLDHIIFWNERDLQKKLERFQQYYNNERKHSSLSRKTPNEKYDFNRIATVDNFRWKSHANGLFQLPMEA